MGNPEVKKPRTLCTRCRKPVYRDSDGWWHYYAEDWGNPKCLSAQVKEADSGREAAEL